MKSHLVIALLFLIAFSASEHLYAQEQTVSLTSGGSPVVSGYGAATPVSFANTRGSKFDASIDFGDVSAGNSRIIQIIVPVRISASSNYKIELQRLPSNGGIRPEKIGFSVQDVRAQVGSSAKLNPNAVNGAIIQKRFGAESAAIIFKGGKPQFQTTLADISESPTTILSGISTLAAGKLGEDGNSILVNLKFTIALQYYTPTDSFSLPLIINITPVP